MTEADEVAQVMFDATPRINLPVSRDQMFQFVYKQMPEESFTVMNAVTDALMKLAQERRNHGPNRT